MDNSPILLGRLMWVVKYGPSKVHSHIQVLDVKHIYYATMGRQKKKTKNNRTNKDSTLIFYYYSLRKCTSWNGMGLDMLN